jgi:hypothetical protein
MYYIKKLIEKSEIRLIEQCSCTSQRGLDYVSVSGSSESISTDGSSDSITSPLIPRDTSIPQGPIEQVWACPVMHETRS